MKKMKKLKLFVLSFLLVLFVVPFGVFAEEDNNELVKEKINVYMFRGEGCGFCAKALTFFDSIEEEYGVYFNLVTYEVWNNADNASLFEDVADYLKVEPDGVPFIVIGSKTYSGFDESWGDDIKSDIIAEYNRSVEERTDAIKAVENKKDNSAVIVVVSVILVVGVVALVAFGRKGVEEIPEESVSDDNKKINKSKKIEEQDNFLEKELDEDDFISEPVKEEKKVAKNSKKIKEAEEKVNKEKSKKDSTSVKKNVNSSKKKSTGTKKK